jgi:chromosome segregation ATPase
MNFLKYGFLLTIVSLKEISSYKIYGMDQTKQPLIKNVEDKLELEITKQEQFEKNQVKFQHTTEEEKNNKIKSLQLDLSKLQEEECILEKILKEKEDKKNESSENCEKMRENIKKISNKLLKLKEEKIKLEENLQENENKNLEDCIHINITKKNNEITNIYSEFLKIQEEAHKLQEIFQEDEKEYMKFLNNYTDILNNIIEKDNEISNICIDFKTTTQETMSNFS